MENKALTESTSPPILYPYQKEGIQWMIQREKASNPCGGILADEMGLGKTVQALHVIMASWNSCKCVSDTHQCIPQKTLVVTPKSVQDQWLDEAMRHTPILRSHMILYNSKVTNAQIREARIVLVTYESLRREEKALVPKLLPVVWYRVILDESHIIRNSNTSQAKVAKRLQATVRWGLSGTPFQNKLADMAGQCAFLKCEPEGKLEWWQRSSARQVDEWRSRVVLRRTKKQVLKDHLQPVEMRTFDVHFEAYEHAAENSMISMAADEIERHKRAGIEGLELEKIRIVWLLRLRQLASDWRLLDEKNQKIVQEHIAEAKRTSTSNGGGDAKTEEQKAIIYKTGSKTRMIYQTIGHLLKHNSDDKIIVFSQWTTYLNLLQEYLGTTIVARLDGTMSSKVRREQLKRFRTDKVVRIFLVSLGAGGLGLNLTEANHVLMCDQWFNPFQELQAQSRADRLGQKKTVKIYRFETKTTIEECMAELKRLKQNSASACMDRAQGVTYKDAGGVFDRLILLRTKNKDATKPQSQPTNQIPPPGIQHITIPPFQKVTQKRKVREEQAQVRLADSMRTFHYYQNSSVPMSVSE